MDIGLDLVFVSGILGIFLISQADPKLAELWTSKSLKYFGFFCENTEQAASIFILKLFLFLFFYLVTLTSIKVGLICFAFGSILDKN
jgi:hypothetical protein